MAQYFDYVLDEETLNRLHSVELDMMDAFVAVCDKYRLDYFLDHGTALGAVRHNGFIPWDDDMDVAMFRKDYDRFVQVAQKELGDGYFVQTYDTDPAYFNFHLKIRMEHTVFPQHYTVDSKHRGIQLDIFPLDNLPGDRKTAERWIALVQFVRKLHDYRAAGLKIHKSPLKKLIYILLSVIPTHFLRRTVEGMCTRFNDRDTRYVTCLSYGSIRKHHTHFYDRGDMLPSQLHPFEDRTYKIMHNPDAYLTALYGDYHVLPPEDQRGCHVYGRIIFDTAGSEEA